jgi:choline kinase
MAHPFHTAVLVAAGRGSRLHPLTERMPKGLLPIAGEPLLVRSVRLLQRAGVRRIAVVVGFEKAQIEQHLGDRCAVLVNPFYTLCNNLGSLWFARAFVGAEPFVYLHGDVVFDPEILERALEGASERDELHLVAEYGPVDEEAMKVCAGEDGALLDIGKEVPLEQATGEWIGLGLVNSPARLFEVVQDELLRGGHAQYDAAAFLRLAREGARVRCSPTGALPWREIDFVEDYEAARRLFP